MGKLTFEDKIKIYQKRKKGTTLSDLSKQYQVNVSVIKYLVRLIDKHGEDVLKRKGNRKFLSYQKEEIINRVLLSGEAITSVALDEQLPSAGML